MRRPGKSATCIGLAALVGALFSGCGARTELLEETASGADGCFPSHEVCNGKDDDCNGIVDDVHRPGGLDGCLRFGRLGQPALTSDSKLEAFLEDNGALVERISDAPRIDLHTLDRFDIVIIEAPTRVHDTGEARLVFDYVISGHGLLVTSGYRIDEGDKPETNSMIAELGVAYVGDLLNGDVTGFAKHPTTEGVERLPFLGGYAIAPLNQQGAAVEPVAAFEGGTVGGVLALGKGRVFFWGDDWIEFDQEWTGDNDTPRFWLDVMRWLAKQS
jgi:hypothetical protein